MGRTPNNSLHQMRGKHMKRYLYISIACFVVAIIAALFIGCSHVVQPTCVSRSLFTAVGVALESKNPVRIVISHTSVKGIDHAQAQALVKGRLVWLTQYGDRVELSDVNEEIWVDPSYRPFTAYKYLTVSELVNELKHNGKVR